MTLIHRPYQDEEDYWRIREFLRQVYLRNQRREPSWHVVRFDYWRWHGAMNVDPMNLEDVVQIWESAGAGIGAVLTPENRGEAFLHIDPQVHTRGLVEEMIAAAELALAAQQPDGTRSLRVWSDQHDATRQDILQRRGYLRGQWPEFQRRRSLGESIASHAPASGYDIRALGGDDELPRRSWVSWRAFHPNAPDHEYTGHDWYRNVQRAPLYRRDLDLVAVAPGGEFAAFCAAWFDDVSRSGILEPVGTAPEHQRRGLGKALLAEALRRLQRLGATIAAVSSYSEPAHSLYAAAGFADYDLNEPWSKTW
jgi:mycothiol synthase